MVHIKINNKKYPLKWWEALLVAAVIGVILGIVAFMFLVAFGIILTCMVGIIPLMLIALAWEFISKLGKR